jgi:hypothetical protein
MVAATAVNEAAETGYHDSDLIRRRELGAGVWPFKSSYFAVLIVTNPPPRVDISDFFSNWITEFQSSTNWTSADQREVIPKLIFLLLRRLLLVLF